MKITISCYTFSSAPPSQIKLYGQIHTVRLWRSCDDVCWASCKGLHCMCLLHITVSSLKRERRLCVVVNCRWPRRNNRWRRTWSATWTGSLKQRTWMRMEINVIYAFFAFLLHYDHTGKIYSRQCINDC